MASQDNADRAAETVPAQTRRRLGSSAGAGIIRQIQAIDAWNTERQARERQLEAACHSRHDQEVARRQADVLHRTQQAIRAIAATELARQPGPLLGTAPTAVIAHRHAWFAEKVAGLLQAQGISIVACTANGADALGAVIAAQPDVVLAGDRLEMMPGDVLIAETRLFSPDTLRTAQVADSQPADAWLSQVDAVFLRHHPPADVAKTLAALCLAPAAGYDRV